MRGKDLSGKRFGRLVAKEVSGRKDRLLLWRCICDCGKEALVRSKCLVHGETRSCGCLRKELQSERSRSHGMSGTRTYICWASMMQRCFNKNTMGYPRYGGRGIKPVKKWRKFAGFYMDMGDCPEGMTLERKDTNAGYEPDNCHWATMKKQADNKTNTIRLEHEGQTKTLTEWAAATGIPRGTLYERLFRLGWDLTKALSIPAGSGRNRRKKAAGPRPVPHPNEVRIIYLGQTKTLMEWSKETGLPPSTIRSRLAKGWSVDRVFGQPKKAKARQITLGEETHTAAEWSRILCIDSATIYRRMKAGLPPEHILKR